MVRRRKIEEWEARLGTSSFNPLEVMQLQDAVRDRKESVLLGSRTFTLTYRIDKVFYAPVEGFIPCGWIEIDRLMERGGV